MEVLLLETHGAPLKPLKRFLKVWWRYNPKLKLGENER
jgi:hypothetical protein